MIGKKKEVILGTNQAEANAAWNQRQSISPEKWHAKKVNTEANIGTNNLKVHGLILRIHHQRKLCCVLSVKFSLKRMQGHVSGLL